MGGVNYRKKSEVLVTTNIRDKFSCGVRAPVTVYSVRKYHVKQDITLTQCYQLQVRISRAGHVKRVSDLSPPSTYFP
jgi:hypothetical protein